MLYNKVDALHMYIYPFFFGFPFHLGHHRAVEFPELYHRFSLVIYFIQSINSVYMSVPISRFIPLPFPHLVSIHLFSMSISLFLFCK